MHSFPGTGLPEVITCISSRVYLTSGTRDEETWPAHSSNVSCPLYFSCCFSSSLFEAMSIILMMPYRPNDPVNHANADFLKEIAPAPKTPNQCMISPKHMAGPAKNKTLFNFSL